MKQLNTIESGICKRLREARETLGLTREKCASRIGLPASTIGNYEAGVARLPVDVALMFCREFIINEEWLATGSFARLRKIPWSPAFGDVETWEREPQFFFRQHFDLRAETMASTLGWRGPFSRVFSERLAAIYDRQIPKASALIPTLYVPDTASTACLLSLLQVVNSRVMRLLELQAGKVELSPAGARSDFFLKLVALLPIIYRRFLGQSTEEVLQNRWQWLRDLANDPSKPIGHFAWQGLMPDIDARETEKNILTETAIYANLLPVNVDLGALRIRAKKITSRRGKATELARFLNAPLASVSRWLSGDREPGGATALKLLEWVERQEAKQ